MKFFVVLCLVLGALQICYADEVQKATRLPGNIPFAGPCGPTTPKNCTRSGPFCETCTSLVLCLKVNDHTYEKVPGDTCVAPQKCIENGCSLALDPICDGVACLDFPCKSVGIFPHPFDCKSFVMCVHDAGKLKAFLNTCDAGWGYDLAKAGCDMQLDNDRCPGYPVTPCQRVGDHGALHDNPSIYYVCEQYSTTNKVLYPVIHRCSHGQVFNDFECRDPNEPTTTNAPTTAP